MKINELIQSTAKVKHRGKSFALAKKFGKILLYNQMVTVRKFGTVINVSMMIGGVSDMIKTASGRAPVAYHKVTMSIKGIKQTYYTPSELVTAIRGSHKEYSDAEKYKNADVLQAVLDNPGGFFKDATVFRTTNDAGKGFSVVSNKIPEDSEVQVWCSCSDYYWTFQYYNCDHDVDIYKQYPNRYIPKTKKGYEAFKKNQPLRNPGKNPGMCKHLMLLLATLMEKGVIEEKGASLTKYYKANYSKFQRQQRLSIGEYENRINQYQRDHDIKTYEREVQRNAPGYRKSGWNNKTGKHSWRHNK